MTHRHLEPSTDVLPTLRNHMLSTVRRAATVLALLGAFAVTTAGAASAASYTVDAPGTPVTEPCSTTFTVKTNTAALPPATFSSTTTCNA